MQITTPVTASTSDTYWVVMRRELVRMTDRNTTEVAGPAPKLPVKGRRASIPQHLRRSSRG